MKKIDKNITKNSFSEIEMPRGKEKFFESNTLPSKLTEKKKMEKGEKHQFIVDWQIENK